MRSLSTKLILAFLLVSLTGTALGAILAGLTTASQFNQFVADQAELGLVASLATYYETQGSWDGVAELFRFNRPWRSRGPGEMGGMPPPALIDADGRVLIGGGDHAPGGIVSPAERSRGIPIEVNGQQVGALLPARGPARLPSRPANSRAPAISGAPAGVPAETTFLRRVNLTLMLSALGATAVALVLGVLLARYLTRPLDELTAATRAVARGDLEQTVPVRSGDELGQLAAAFNQMSADLARASRLRRQMTADIAHDLRTPLSVILGYTEALHDEKLVPTQELFGVMHREAGHLSHLVEDLRTLSLADAGELPLSPQPVSPATLLQETVQAYRAAADGRQLQLQVDAAAGLPPILADPDRLAQVLGNLMSNALRHTPPGGTVSLAARHVTGRIDPAADAGPRLEIRVSDTGSGIPAPELPYVFDRFYRGDQARQQAGGESGLGLAIAKSIVEAHAGAITAHSVAGEGTTFVVSLPYRRPPAPPSERRTDDHQTAGQA